MTMNELVDKKTGCPLLLGKELDKHIRAYLMSLGENGAVINNAIRMACAQGVCCVKCYDSNHWSVVEDTSH